MRELSTIKVGYLTKINGQVVRTHSVHPVHPQDEPGQEGVQQHHQLLISHHPRQRQSREALLEFLKLFYLAGTSLRGKMSVSGTAKSHFLKIFSDY